MYGEEPPRSVEQPADFDPGSSPRRPSPAAAGEPGAESRGAPRGRRSEMSHLASTISVAHCAFRAMSAMSSRSCSTTPCSESTRTSATSARSAASSAQLRVVLDPLTVLPLRRARRCRQRNSCRRAEAGVDRVAGRSGDVGDDHPLHPDQGVQKRRLADVRATEDRHPDRLAPPRPAFAEAAAHRMSIEQVARSVPVQRREGHGVAKAEAVELEREFVLQGSSILLAGSRTGLRALAEGCRPTPRRRPWIPARRVDEKDDVSLVDRGSRLLGDGFETGRRTECRRRPCR